MISFSEIAQRMDPIRTPSRLRGSQVHPREGLEQWYYEPLVSTLPYASQIGRWHRTDKGLCQMHRSLDGAPLRSLRDIGLRHADPDRRFTILWYNTWLIDPPATAWDPPELAARGDAIGHRIGQGPWDVAALCEVFEEPMRERICAAVGQHRPYEAAWGGTDALALASSGLLDLAFNGSSLEHGDFYSFEAEGSGLDVEGLASKGVLYRLLRLRKDADADGFTINLFTTHLHAEKADVRNKQLKELKEFVKATRDPASPTLIAGDFNVRAMGGDRVPYVPPDAGRGEWTVTSEFDKLLQALSDFEDLGLTRGGLAASTHSQSDYSRACYFDQSAPWETRYCDDYPPLPLTDEQVPGYRIDYVFLERPREEHNCIVDVARIRRRPMFRDRLELHAGYLGQHLSPTPVLALDPNRFWTQIPAQQRRAIRQAAGAPASPLLDAALSRRYCGFLSDHLAIELDVILTPRTGAK